MRFLTPIILVAVLCQSVHMQGAGNTAADCCLHTSGKRIPFSMISRYEIQGLDRGCGIDAVVFLLKNLKNLCATPGLQWVEKTMKKLDQKEEKNKKNKTGTKKKASQKKNPQPRSN